jgi:hypothetical protein
MKMEGRFRLRLAEKLGTSPVLEDEDKALYDQLYNRVSDDVGPTDIIERICVRDVVDDTWVVFRWRRLATMIGPSMFKYVTEIFRDDVTFDDSGNVYGHVRKHQEFSEFAQRAQRVECLINNAVQRRNATLREIGRRRFLFAQQLRKSVDQADVQVLGPKLRTAKSA